MLHIVWRFRAKPARLADFLDAYNPSGAWARLFRRSPEYRGTQVWSDAQLPDSFLVIDSWNSPEAFARFRAQFAFEYEALDRDCEQLTLEEIKIGEYEDLG